MKTLFKTTTLLSILVLIVAGCATTPIPSDNDKLKEFLENGGLITEETGRGVVVYLPALFFTYGSATLLPEAQDKIRYIGDAINQDFALRRNIAVEGHTDAIGNNAYNLSLSKQRAESVADELVFSKVASERIAVDWFGETVPIAPNQNADGTDNPEGRAKNRRVEFIILNENAE